jgi:hypothetical protein
MVKLGSRRDTIRYLPVHDFRIEFVGAVALGALLLPSSVVQSQSRETSTGIADDAMPGILRVDDALPAPSGIALSVGSGYGYTGAELDDGDTHHRGSGRLVVSYPVLPALSVALRFDGRYDKHQGTVGGSDDGWVGDPRLIGRFQHTFSDTLSAGLQLGFWAPSSDVPSIDIDALSIEGVGALTYSAPTGAYHVSLNAGYRVDRSAASVEESERLSLADRLSLGLSDFNAVLFGVGASYKVGKAELLAEWSLDYLHGKGKPSFSQSPMRIGAGARFPLTDTVALFGQADFRLSSVDAAEVMTSLLPFEPKIQALFGMNMRFGADKPPVQEQIIVVDDKKDDVPPPPPPTMPFQGVIKSGGTPVANASLVLRDKDGNEKTGQTGADGSFTIDEVLLGAVTLTIKADGFEDKQETVNLAEGSVAVEISLEAVLPPGQLRGLVRSFKGKGLKAELRIMPSNQTLETAADGSFELDLPPGDYDVTVTVQGFKEQTRQIHIDDGGVTIMNVDLRK